MVFMDKEKPEKRASRLIQELDIDDKEDAEKYEKCETAARLVPREVLETIDNPEQKAEIEWIKESHKKGFPSLDNWRNAFAQEINNLIEDTGGLEKIKKWHRLEAVCEELSEEEIDDIDEENRGRIRAIKNIHDRASQRRIEIIQKINKISEFSKQK